VVEVAAAPDVSDVDRDVVEFLNCHYVKISNQ
jgi:hypothetical protein